MTVERTDPAPTRATWCAECGKPSGAFWRGWRAYRSDDLESADAPALVIFCSVCARREFGPQRRRRARK